jgi:hypothetical protein
MRDKIVHEGKGATHEEVARLAELVSRVIPRFAGLDLKTFDKFKKWIDVQKYSVDMKELERNTHVFS